MTVRDPEILELLKDEPELLALSDAVSATQRPAAPPRLRRAAPRAALVAGLAAAIVLAILLWPGGGRNGILDRALAAIGNGRVFHLVAQTSTGTVFYDLRTGHRTGQTIELELWIDRSSKRTHVIVRERGRIVGDILLPEDAARSGGTVGPIDPAFAALWSGYRQALESGQAKLERKGAVAGHGVFWLAFASVQPGVPGTEVAIDRVTYKPVLFRTHTRGGHIDSRVLVAETTGFRAAEFRRRGPSSLVGRTSSGGSSESSGDARGLLRAPWLTPGPRVAGLRLTTVHAVTATSNGRTAHGLELVYGATDHGFARQGPQSLTIQESSAPDDPSVWKQVPPGKLSVQKSDFGGNGGSHPFWIGYAVVRGIYVTIQTGRTEAALVEAARALRPA